MTFGNHLGWGYTRAKHEWRFEFKLQRKMPLTLKSLPAALKVLEAILEEEGEKATENASLDGDNIRAIRRIDLCIPRAM